MQYLVATENEKPFFTDWFDLENHFNPKLGMVVYDLVNRKFTSDGVAWHPILEDSL